MNSKPNVTRCPLRPFARAKKAGQMETAVAYWEEAAQGGDWLALRELALHHEHRSRDLPAALSAVESGLGRLDGEHGPVVASRAGSAKAGTLPGLPPRAVVEPLAIDR